MRMAGLVAAAIVMAICSLYSFLTFFLRYFFRELAAHSKRAMIVVLVVVNVLPNVGSAFTVCMF